jgi:putative DNA primase/helicase
MSASKNGHGFSHTELGNAEFFAALYGKRLRYDHCLRRWLEWDAKRLRWTVDEEKKIVALAGKAIRHRLQLALRMPQETDAQRAERASEISWCVRSESVRGLKAMLELAQSLKPIRDSGKEWDTNPWLLGVDNGVVDLKTGRLREGKLQDRITKFSPVNFDPDAACPRFDRFMLEIFSDDWGMVNWMNRALGYCISGSVREHFVFMPFGLGANGKSTLIEIIFYVLGDYATGMEPGILDRNPNRHLAEGVNLMGARFAKSVETREGRQIDEERLKAWSGGDTITARPLYKHPVSFPATHKLWLAFNHKPVITDLTEGTWRRVKVIPFERNFEAEGKADPDLPDTLKQEAEGILARLVAGCLQWQCEGLRDVPAKIAAATRDYEEKSNPLADFISERCLLGASHKSKPKTLPWRRYTEYCRDNALRRIEHAQFGSALLSMGCWEGREPGTGAHFWGGIALKPPFDFDEPEPGL